MRGFLNGLTILLLLCISVSQLFAQDLTTNRDTLIDGGEMSGLTVEADRMSALTSENAPLGISNLMRTEARRYLEPGLSLDEILSELPGLFVSDRGNATLGERISIRGMGWRAAFGVRGVQILLDGIPLTMPDGQSVSDIISPSMVQSAELIRGPSSLFWGNGSGGVLFLSSAGTNTTEKLRLRAMGGSDGLQQFNIESSASIGKNRFQLFVSDDRRDGHRDYSESRFTRAAFNGQLLLKEKTILTLTSAFAYQDANNPGSLTREQVDEDPSLANARNLSTLAGKKSLQFQAGASILQETNIGAFSATAYGLIRDLDNPLSFTYIDLNRSAYGTRIALQNSADKISWGVGLDADFQDDDRRNVNNVDGEPGDEIDLAQDEKVRNISLYGFLNATIAGPLKFTAGLRNDQIRFSMDDRLLENGDQSGNRTFSALSPAIGLSYTIDKVLLYTNYRSSFETPTTTELVNSPNLNGGFNPDVDPQKVNGLEVGIRGRLEAWSTHFDVALYSMNVNDLLIPFQTEAGGDRTFYRNGGRNLHQGIEIALRMEPNETLSLQFTHTSGKFEFRSDALKGNDLPGLPGSRTFIRGALNIQGFWIASVFEHVSSFFSNDANDEINDAYAVLDLTIGHKAIYLRTLTLRPFFRISNLTDTSYNGSVVVNAFGGRFFEPAAGRSFQLGLNVSI